MHRNAAMRAWTEDMNDSELPGISAFLQVDGEVFHTYSTYGRGIEEFHNGYHYLDLTALGRQEEWEAAGTRGPAGTAGGWTRDAPPRRIRHLTRDYSSSWSSPGTSATAPRKSSKPIRTATACGSSTCGCHGALRNVRRISSGVRR
jgi:hypothetical protein